MVGDLCRRTDEVVPFTEPWGHNNHEVAVAVLRC